jgi:hypothetical protein|tara:strand:+ start:1678 stop:2406 length:729 start_codon:yes stop_codon:yes gene_type:complete
MSNKDELDTIVPSGVAIYGKTNAKKGRKAPEQLLFERAINAAWLTHQRGFPLEPQTVHEQDRSLSVPILTQLLATAKFRTALEARGIPAEVPVGITAEQAYALTVMTDQSMSLDPFQRLKKLGISWAQWQGWVKQPMFSRIYSKTSEDLLRSSVPAALTALSNRAQAGNNDAIKYLLAITGYYDPSAKGSTGEYERVISAMIDAVEKHVEDPEALKKISAAVSEAATRWNVPLAVEAEIVED